MRTSVLGGRHPFSRCPVQFIKRTSPDALPSRIRSMSSKEMQSLGSRGFFSSVVTRYGSVSSRWTTLFEGVYPPIPTIFDPITGNVSSLFHCISMPFPILTSLLSASPTSLGSKRSPSTSCNSTSFGTSFTWRSCCARLEWRVRFHVDRRTSISAALCCRGHS